MQKELSEIAAAIHDLASAVRESSKCSASKISVTGGKSIKFGEFKSQAMTTVVVDPEKPLWPQLGPAIQDIDDIVVNHISKQIKDKKERDKKNG